MSEPPLHLFPHQQKKLNDLEKELRVCNFMKWFILLLVLFFCGYSWENLGTTGLMFFVIGSSYSWFVQRGKEKHKELLEWRLKFSSSVDKGGD